MPAVECPVEVALAELADALRTTDMTWPRHDDEDFVGLRALAWSRCLPYLPEFRDWQPMDDEERQRLLDGFAPVDDTVARSLADLFLDYGDGYTTSGPLCWSPGRTCRRSHGRWCSAGAMWCRARSRCSARAGRGR